MKTIGLLILTLLTVGSLLPGQRENLRMPELTAAEWAVFEGVSWIKGRLPNQDGFRIGQAQVFLRQNDGEEKPLMPVLELEYSTHRYSDTGELSDPMGYLVVFAEPSDEALKVVLVARNKGATHRVQAIAEELAGYSVSMTRGFDHETGNTVRDYRHVVPLGRSELFTLVNPEGSVLTVILRCDPPDGG